jgi:hypothetical protein
MEPITTTLVDNTSHVLSQNLQEDTVLTGAMEVSEHRKPAFGASSQQ